VRSERVHAAPARNPTAEPKAALASATDTPAQPLIAAVTDAGATTAPRIGLTYATGRR
jgi:hypothetical protein